MKPRFTIFAFVASVCFAFIGYANMYNDWAQKNAVNLSSSANRMECNETSCVQGGLLSTSYSNAGTAAFAAAERFRGKECGIGVESSYIIYEKDGYYYLGTKAWYSNATKARGSAPVEYDQELISQGYNPVAVVHDHPNSKTPWFSTGDAKGSKANELDCYVYTCNGARHGVLALDHNDGKVYEINPHTGMRTGIGKTSPPVNLVRKSGSVGDKDPYQGVLSYQAFPGRNDKVVAAEGLSEIEIDSLCKKNDPLEEKVCHADSVSVNDLKATDVADANSVNLAGEVGVRGWCDCGDHHGRRYIVGDMFCMYEKLECDLAYTLCGRCGCVVRPKDCAGKGLQIVDVRLYKELKQKRGRKLAWLDAFEPLKARQSKIEAIPNGQIVVGGLCACKVADPINVGFTNKISGEFYVCCNCGRVRAPDENGGIPNGPTALSEMGLNEQAERESERIRNWLGEGKSLK